MPSFEKHCGACRKVFGEDFAHVHRWLDELAVIDGRLDINHHRHRHHAGGVEQVRLIWGERAARAAANHVRLDEGRVYSEEKMRKLYPDAPEWKNITIDKKGKL